MVGANSQAGTAEHGLGAGSVKILACPGLRPSKRSMSRLKSLIPKWGPAKADGLCGEEEMPSHWRNFLLAENVAVWLAR